MNQKIIVAKTITFLSFVSLSYRVKRKTYRVRQESDAQTASVSGVGPEDESSYFEQQDYECGGNATTLKVPEALKNLIVDVYFAGGNNLNYTHEQCMIACHHHGSDCKGFSEDTMNHNGCVLKSQDCDGDDAIKCYEKTKPGICLSGYKFWKKKGNIKSPPSKNHDKTCLPFNTTVDGHQEFHCTLIIDNFPGTFANMTGASDKCTLTAAHDGCTAR
eukprot:TRINITY_DN60989_c0_g1_i1.p1 TRINITY_DN60989_c0_g1~~TRINITY_DN60989_c0_g1_i1.p1  ORF type:complete len:217 (-),score=15.60 TRINITY_DN60989_c0_g1_i1:70-720(-)